MSADLLFRSTRPQIVNPDVQTKNLALFVYDDATAHVKHMCVSMYVCMHVYVQYVYI